MSELLERLVRDHGAVSIMYVPQNAEAPWTITLLRSRVLPAGVGHPTEESEWWDHAHGPSVEEAVRDLLADLA